MAIRLKGIVLRNLVERYKAIQKVLRMMPPLPKLPGKTDSYSRIRNPVTYNKWMRRYKESTKDIAKDSTSLRDDPTVFFALASNAINELAEFLIWVASFERHRSEVCKLYGDLEEIFIKPIIEVPQIKENISQIVDSLYKRSCTKGISLQKNDKPKRSLFVDLVSEMRQSCRSGRETSLDCYRTIFEKTLSIAPLQDMQVQQEIERILLLWKKGMGPSGAISFLLNHKLDHYRNYVKQFKPEHVPVFYKKFNEYLREKSAEFKPKIPEMGSPEWETITDECANDKLFKLEKGATCLYITQ